MCIAITYKLPWSLLIRTLKIKALRSGAWDSPASNLLFNSKGTSRTRRRQHYKLVVCKNCTQRTAESKEATHQRQLHIVTQGSELRKCFILISGNDCKLVTKESVLSCEPLAIFPVDLFKEVTATVLWTLFTFFQKPGFCFQYFFNGF